MFEPSFRNASDLTSLRNCLRARERADSWGEGMSEPILEVTDLVKEFAVSGSNGLRKTKAIVQAVSGVSFTVEAGQTAGLVGESGSGKPTVGRTILRLTEPTSGSVKFTGQEIVGLERQKMRKLRREMQIVFQDPQASLDPRLTVGSAIAEPLRIQKVKGDHNERVQELLELVGLAPDHARRVIAAGAGVRLLPRKCTPEGLREAVEQVLFDSGYRENARRIARELNAAPGPPGAAQLIERMVARA